MVLPCVGQHGTQAGDSQAFGPGVNQFQLVGMDVTGEDLPLPLHGNGGGKGFSAGGSAHILHPVAFFEPGHHRHQMGGGILDHKPPLRKGRQALQAPGTGHRETVGQPPMALYIHTRLPKLLQ